MSFYPNKANHHIASSTQSYTSKPQHCKRLCSVLGCKNGIVQGGVCVSHGAKRRKCQVEGCDKNAKCVGRCSAHGYVNKVSTLCNRSSMYITALAYTSDLHERDASTKTVPMLPFEVAGVSLTVQLRKDAQFMSVIRLP